MARDISGRIGRLNARRKGTDRLTSLAMDAQRDVLTKSVLSESWQKRASASQPYTRYALGAMQEVGPDYTRISIETAERVGKQLKDVLTAEGLTVDFRLQGSVPANLHIRGVSDVDLLTLENDFLTYATAGWRSRSGLYSSPTTKTSLGVLLDLRQRSERILKAKYPAATVDCSGGKAVNITGGSLARPVDVVPSHWNDNVEYQSSGQAHDRGVVIVDKKVPKTIDNLPFKHIKLINDRDALAKAGLKKSIRLCKNVKNDAIEEGKTIKLPSFDIAALMYHADLHALSLGVYYELGILAETQRHLDYLVQHETEARRLRTPDDSRVIIDSAEKFAALRTLSIEMDDLLTEVAKEQDARFAFSTPTWSDSRQILANRHIPFL